MKDIRNHFGDYKNKRQKKVQGEIPQEVWLQISELASEAGCPKKKLAQALIDYAALVALDQWEHIQTRLRTEREAREARHENE